MNLQDAARAQPVAGYVLLFELARGGMGVTYVATRTLEEPLELVVVKRPKADILESRTARRRFYHEAMVNTALHDRNLVRTITTGEDPSGPFLVLEYVHGTTLEDLTDRVALAGRDFPVEAAAHITSMCLLGLDALHRGRLSDGTQLGIVHRDLCPSNIMISLEGQAKLGDLGIAKSNLSTVSTEADFVLGHLPFLAPEYLKERKSTFAVDTYALGISIWSTLAGKLPFSGPSPAQLLRQILTQRTPPLATQRPDVPLVFDELVGRMCHPRADARPSIEEALQRLRETLHLPTSGPTKVLHELVHAVAEDDLRHRLDVFRQRARQLQAIRRHGY